jgi:hypothetical protein
MPFSCLRFLAPIFRYHTHRLVSKSHWVSLVLLLLLLLVGRESTWYCGHYWPIVAVPDDIDDGDCGAIGGMKIGKKTCSSTTLSITNPTWPDPSSNPGRRGGKPATSRLIYGTGRVSLVACHAHVLCAAYPELPLLLYVVWTCSKLVRPACSAYLVANPNSSVDIYGSCCAPLMFLVLWFSDDFCRVFCAKRYFDVCATE